MASTSRAAGVETHDITNPHLHGPVRLAGKRPSLFPRVWWSHLPLSLWSSDWLALERPALEDPPLTSSLTEGQAWARALHLASNPALPDGSQRPGHFLVRPALILNPPEDCVKTEPR